MLAMQKIRTFTGREWKKLSVIALVLFLLVVIVITTNYLIIGSYRKYLYNSQSLPNDSSIVGVVLGGGIENGQPRPLLRDRLDTAASLLETGKVRKLLVSGDNRFAGYNEPEVMKNYLVNEKAVDPEKIQLDNAGRSTYETCERARKIFDLRKAILISESTHLPRAIYTCRSFGIETYGYSSDGQSSAGLRVGQRFREILARTKATINIYIIGERTILGSKIEI
jgi:vancomycin permeability regulator SanA